MMVLRKLDKIKSYCACLLSEYFYEIDIVLDIWSYLITFIVALACLLFTLLSMLLMTLTTTNIYIVLLPSDNDNLTLSTG